MYKGILLSGGIDSTSLAFWKRPEYAFTINYGQKPANAEIAASKAVCDKIGMQHIVINVDCSHLGSGDLIEEKALEVAPSSEWWPYRNQLLVTIACMKAISIGIDELMVASVKSDGFHKDGTAKFYALLNDLMTFQEGAIAITVPAINYTSIELVVSSQISSDILFYAHSCHKGNIPCGHCGGCYKYISVIQSLKNAAWEKPSTP